jgi:hypothetical protein
MDERRPRAARDGAVLSSRRCAGRDRPTSRTACPAWSPARRRTSPACPTRWWTSSTRAVAPAPSAWASPSRRSRGPATSGRSLSPVYREEREGDALVHHAGFDAGGARTLRDLFDLVRHLRGVEVLVDGKKAPYGHELWLPLFWIFVGGEA